MTILTILFLAFVLLGIGVIFWLGYKIELITRAYSRALLREVEIIKARAKEIREGRVK